jgi:hypothetical protein
MPDLPISLDALIATVRTAAPDEPLAQLEAAARLKNDVGELTDALLGHFVDQARRDGCSWSQIGDALGVSKQAAQQKHTPRVFTGERFTDRARVAVAEAGSAARRLGHGYVGTEHLLLGLMAPPIAEGLANRVLGERGITAERVEAHVVAVTGRGEHDGTGVLPHTPRAARVLGATLHVALELGHNYIGTEHLRLALYREPEGIAARFLAASGLTEEEARNRVVQLCLEIAAAKGL